MIGHLKIGTRPGLQPVGLSWALDPTCGWGNYGTQICLHLNQSSMLPIPLGGALMDRLTTLQKSLLQSNIAISHKLKQTAAENNLAQVHFEFPVLHALDFRLAASEKFRGGTNIGLVFFEGSDLPPQSVAAANSDFDLICAGSTWNAKVLREHDVQRVATVIQGIDPTLFHPAPKSGLLGDRFVVFSGGKLEFRKGQDIVVAAFRAFCRKHPDALLLTSWHNHWPNLMRTIGQMGHVTGPPEVNEHGLQISSWLQQNGIPAKNILDMGLIPNHMMASVMREADIAVFPNRAEGGTNLVAMECMASGVPCVLSANTGHLDLLGDDHCYSLERQDVVEDTPGFHGTKDWGESDPVELLDKLETAYRSRHELAQVGQAAARFMQDWTWDKRIAELATEVQDVLERKSSHACA